MPYHPCTLPVAYQNLPSVIAHRGASGHAPENTLAACQLAVDQGIQWLEVDVALSADGVPVIFHDDTLERCSNGHGRLIQHTLTELQQLDYGRWYDDRFAGESILQLQHLLHFAARHHIGLNLEIKPVSGQEHPTVWAVASLLHRLPIAFPVLLSSFNPLALEYCQQLMPEYSRAWLTEVLPDDWLRRLEQYQCAGIHYCADFHDSAMVSAIREAGFHVLAYTVNDPLQAAQLLSSGVNAVFSDYPGHLQRSLSSPEQHLNHTILTH